MARVAVVVLVAVVFSASVAGFAHASAASAIAGEPAAVERARPTVALPKATDGDALLGSVPPGPGLEVTRSPDALPVADVAVIADVGRAPHLPRFDDVDLAAAGQAYPTLAALAPGAPLPEADDLALRSDVEAEVPAGPVVRADAAPGARPTSDLRGPALLLRDALLPVGGERGPAAPVAVAPFHSSSTSSAPRLVEQRGDLAAPEAVAAGMAAGFAMVGAALYSRLTAAAVQRSPVRRRILATLRADPGCTAHALARGLGVDDKTVRHHLRKLREAGYVTAVPGRQERLFVAGDLPPEGMRAAAALRAPSARALHAALATGPARAAHLAAALGISEATTSVQLRRLAAAGLVARQPDGTWHRTA